MTPDIQRAGLGRRLSAWLLDTILLGCLSVALALALSAISGYDAQIGRLETLRQTYGERYGVDMELSGEALRALPADEQARLAEAEEAFGRDGEAARLFRLILSMTVMIASLGILLACLLLEFALPLLLRNGQTVGKRVFGVALMRTDGVRIPAILLFVRAILGKYTIGIMIPALTLILLYFRVVGVAGTILLLALCAVQLVLFASTRNHTPLHDLMASTVAVDMASQRIFDTPEERDAYGQPDAGSPDPPPNP